MQYLVKRAAPAALVAAAVFLGGLTPDAQAAERKLTFACCVKGVIEAILVKPGEKVEAGQPLARIGAAIFELRIGVMEANLELAKLAHAAAEKSLAREQELFDAISTTSAKVDEAEIKLAKTAADLVKAKADLEIAKIRLDYTTLKAPFAGTVVSIPGHLGQVMNPDVPQETVIVLDDGQ